MAANNRPPPPTEMSNATFIGPEALPLTTRRSRLREYFSLSGGVKAAGIIAANSDDIVDAARVANRVRQEIRRPGNQSQRGARYPEDYRAVGAARRPAPAGRGGRGGPVGPGGRGGRMGMAGTSGGSSRPPPPPIHRRKPRR